MDSLYSRAIRLAGNAEKAEELIQVAYFEAYHDFPNYYSEANFKQWIHNILYNIYTKQFQAEPVNITHSLDYY